MFDNVKKACQKPCSSDCENTQIGPIYCIDCYRSKMWKEKDLKMTEVIQLVTTPDSGSPDIISTNFDQ